MRFGHRLLSEFRNPRVIVGGAQCSRRGSEAISGLKGWRSHPRKPHTMVASALLSGDAERETFWPL